MVQEYQGIVQLDQTLPRKKEPKDISAKVARKRIAGVGSKPANLSAYQATEMKHGKFGPIFNAYGLNPGVIGSIDVYNVNVDFL